MKKYYLLLAAMMLCAMLSAQTQQGYVKTKGRMVDGQLVPGQGLKGATVCIKGKTAVLVKADNGAFSFPVTETQFRVDSVRKNGYQLVDMDALSKTYKPSANPIYLVMETPEQQLQDQLTAERRIRRTLTDQLRQREDEIEALKEQQKITDEEYRQALQKLYKETDQNEQLVKDMVGRYSTIDYDQLSEFDQKISELILNGELIKADSMLRTKGDINERVEQYRRHEAINAKEREELTKRGAQLEQSEVLALRERDDLANDCYRKFEIFKMQHLYDSAAYYIELRAGLDTTNIEWGIESIDFMKEYLARYDDAIDLYYKLLNISTSIYGINHSYNATILNNIGVVLTKKCQYKQALECYNRTISLASAIDSTNNRNDIIAIAFNNIGTVYCQLDRFEEAITYHDKAKSIFLSIYGENSPKIAQCYINLANDYAKKESYEESLYYLSSALSILLMYYDENNPYIASANNSLGVIYWKKGDYKKALECYQKSLNAYLYTYGNSHPNVATSYNNLGTLKFRLGEYEDAITFFEKALSIRIRFYGQNSEDVANTCNNLGVIYDKIGNLEKALSYYEESLRIRSGLYGESHSSIATLYNNIGVLYDRLGNFEQAICYYGKALNIKESLYGKNSSSVAVSYINIGLAYKDHGDYEMALENFNYALNIQLTIYGDSHLDIATTYSGMGSVYENQKAYEKALNCYLNALQIRQETLGEENSLTIKTKNKISDIQAILKEQESEPKNED